MRIVRDDTKTGIDVFSGGNHRHIHVYAGNKPNDKWKKIKVDVDTIGNCVSIHTFPESIVVGIPLNMLNKIGVVECHLPHFGKHSAATPKLKDKKEQTQRDVLALLTKHGLSASEDKLLFSDISRIINDAKGVYE